MQFAQFLFFLFLALVTLASAQPDPPCERPPPLDCLDPQCHCEYEWIGPKAEGDYWRFKDIYYGNYHDIDSWTPTPVVFGYPCDVCFVTIQGPGTTFIDQDTRVNILTIGGRQWDETSVFLGGAGRTEESVTLTIAYDDVPRIKRVDGQRLCTGETKLTITGEGFGFCPEDLTITVRDVEEDRPIYDHYPGIPSVIPVDGITYNCENPRIYYLDQKIYCYVAIDDVYAGELEVTVQVNIRNPPLSDTVPYLVTYVK